MAWVKSKSNRSFADVLKGKSSDGVLSSPEKSTESSKRLSPMIIRASSSSSSNRSQSGPNREVSKASSTASDKKSEQRLHGARSPLRLSPVTVQGIRSDHSSPLATVQHLTMMQAPAHPRSREQLTPQELHSVT